LAVTPLPGMELPSWESGTLSKPAGEKGTSKNDTRTNGTI